MHVLMEHLNSFSWEHCVLFVLYYFSSLFRISTHIETSLYQWMGCKFRQTLGAFEHWARRFHWRVTPTAHDTGYPLIKNSLRTCDIHNNSWEAFNTLMTNWVCRDRDSNIRSSACETSSGERHFSCSSNNWIIHTSLSNFNKYISSSESQKWDPLNPYDYILSISIFTIQHEETMGVFKILVAIMLQSPIFETLISPGRYRHINRRAKEDGWIWRTKCPFNTEYRFWVRSFKALTLPVFTIECCLYMQYHPSPCQPVLQTTTLNPPPQIYNPGPGLVFVL